MILVAESDRAIRLARVLLDAELPGLVASRDHGVPDEPMVLLGPRVTLLLGLQYMPFSIACGRHPMAVLPHPSSDAWADPMAIGRARATLDELRSLVRESAL